MGNILYYSPTWGLNVLPANAAEQLGLAALPPDAIPLANSDDALGSGIPVVGTVTVAVPVPGTLGTAVQTFTHAMGSVNQFRIQGR